MRVRDLKPRPVATALAIFHRSSGRRIAKLAIIAVMVASAGQPSQAIAEESLPENPLIAAGLEDPGYANVSERLTTSPGNGSWRPGIYLGNQWFLTTNHGGDPGFIQLNGEIYNVIPNQNLVLTNPTGINSDDGPIGPLTTSSDLQLFRLGLNSDGETPELANNAVRTLNNPDQDRRLVIADGAHTNGSDVIAIGLQSSSSINADGNFGTNTIVSDTLIGDTGDSDNHVAVNSNGFDVLLQLTREDQPGSALSTPFEFQAQGGDSGSPVFVRNSEGDFELGGVLHAIFNNNDTNFTGFSDLGSPFATYREQIFEAFDDNNYSVEGDVNLDGSVDEDDLFALADGWLDPESDASVLTWSRGDLNQDGDTDLADFALLRQALGGGLSLGDLNTALAAIGGPEVFAIPEPASALLLMTGSGLLLGARRRR